MNKVFAIIALLTFFGTKNVKADVGPYFGIGAPYVSQMGITFSNSPNLSFDIGYNTISVDVDTATVELSKPELDLRYHIFGGATYFGLGIGYMSLEASADDSGSSQKVTAEAKGLAVTPRLGWLWGRSGGGLIFGIDFGYQIPVGVTTDISAGSLGPGNEAYDDLQDSLDRFAEEGFPVFTMAKLGYLF